MSLVFELQFYNFSHQLFVRDEDTLRWSAVYHKFFWVDIFFNVHCVNELLCLRFAIVDSWVDVTDFLKGSQAVFLLDTDLLQENVKVIFHAFHRFKYVSCVNCRQGLYLRLHKGCLVLENSL